MNQAGITLMIVIAVVGGIIAVLALTHDPARIAGTSSSKAAVASIRLTRSQVTWGSVGLVVGVLIFINTGWYVMLIAGPVAGILLPLFLGKGDVDKTTARLEGLETWSRSLSGLTMAGAGGLEQTLIASLQSAPESIRPHVTSLVNRLNSRWPTRQALEAFASDLDDPTGDLIVMNLLLKEKHRGPGLAPALDDLATIIGEEVKVRRQIEADRAKPRTHIRVVVFATLGILLALPFLGTYTANYSTPFGQILLAVWLILFGVLLTWMRSIASQEPQPRLLVPPSRPQEERS